MGGGGSSRGGGPNYNYSQVVLPDWAQQIAQQNVQNAEALAAQPYTPPPMATVAGLTPDQQAAIEATRENLGITQPAFAQAISEVSNLPAAAQSLLNPYLEQAGGDVVSNMLRTGAMTGQQLSGQAAAANAFGGTRQGVMEANLASETERNVGQALTTLQQQGWNQAMANAFNQASSLGQLASAGQQANLQGINALWQAGSAEQTQNQAQLQDAYQRWQQAQEWPYQQLAISQSALAGTPYGTTTKASQPYSSNPLAQGLGLAASALPAVNQLANWTGLSGLLGGAGGAADAATTASALTDAAALAAPGFAIPTASTAADAGLFGAGMAAADTGAATAAGKGGADAAIGALALA